MSRQHADPIVVFYSGGRDHAARGLDDILAWSDERLESVHDYIQWLFPTRQPSGVNPSAPLVTDETARAFATVPELQGQLRMAFDRMLAFYGLQRTEGSIAIDPARFPARSAVWLTAGNHNHLRLTRIIDSLAQLGLAEDARALRACLLDEIAPLAGSRVTERTRGFWRRAGAVLVTITHAQTTSLPRPRSRRPCLRRRRAGPDRQNPRGRPEGGSLRARGRRHARARRRHARRNDRVRVGRRTRARGGAAAGRRQRHVLPVLPARALPRVGGQHG